MNMTTIRYKFVLAAATAVGLLSAVGSARAEKIYGLTNTGGLFSFDSATPGTVSAVTAITGVTTGQTLVGMDFRPATGELYAMSYVGSTGAAQLYTVNLTTGAATPVGSALSLQTAVTNNRFGFDFNPTVDRIRVISGYGATAATSGANYRLNPNGSIAATDTNAAFASGDANFGDNPGIFGLAYTNNFATATITTLYGYDYTNDVLVTVGSLNGSPTSPNSGQLFTVGASGHITGSGGLDLDVGNSGVLYGNLDSGLYTFNVGTGAATLVGSIGSLSVLDIAVQVVPEPGTYALTGGGLALLLFAHRRRRAAASAH